MRKERILYTYRGDYYQYAYPGLTIRQSKYVTILLVLAGMVMMLFSLSCRSRLNAVPYVGGFSFLAVIPMGFVLVGSLFFLCRSGGMRVQQYRECHGPICYGAVCAGGLMGMSLLGGIVWMLWHREHWAASETVLLAVNAGILAVQCMLAGLHRGRYYRLKTENETLY